MLIFFRDGAAAGRQPGAPARPALAAARHFPSSRCCRCHRAHLNNGSVLAEVFRAGINAVPKGQSEAAYSLGMNKVQVMWWILIPGGPVHDARDRRPARDPAQGHRAGYIIAFPAVPQLLPDRHYGNVIPAALICVVIYIAINISLSRLAIWLEKRNARSSKGTKGTALLPRPLRHVRGTRSTT